MDEKEQTNKNDKISEQYNTLQVLPKPSEDELSQILENHKIWLESNGEEGEQAYLCSADLQKSNFSGMNLKSALFKWSDLRQSNFENTKLQDSHLEESDLQGAILWDADLQGARFDYSNLQKAILWGANLKEAGLKNANLKGARLDRVKGLSEAELQYSNLEGATGLLGNEFSQADVTGTKLPDDIKNFKALEIVKETSQNARKVFFAMLLSCVYSWLTIATTKDVGLLTNTASSPLPIIGTEIPIAWFYIAAPLVLICLYFYFHLYLIKLWESLAGLPAIFPDGKRLDETAYPWLLNGLVRRHFRILKANRPFIAHVQEWITIFLAWWVVPITMIAFWLRYIPRHEWVETIFQIGTIVVSVAFAIIFYRLSSLTLQGKKKAEFNLNRFWKDRRFYYGVSVLMVSLLFSLLSYGAIEGVKKWYWHDWNKEKREIKIPFVEENVPKLFEKFRYSVFANFIEKEISNKPSNYYEITKEERLESVNGANLSNANLNNADMYKAFMVNANLSNTYIYNAHLLKANLEKAVLIKAELEGSFLKEANLKGAILDYADLKKCIFYDSNLQEASIKDAYIQDAYLFRTNLKKANLMRTKLNRAYIFGANLKESILGNADFQEAYLESANLHNADVQEAIFDLADFRHADLTGAKNLTIEQLSKVKTLYQAKLDPDLMEQVEKCCPYLLEKPKEETD